MKLGMGYVSVGFLLIMTMIDSVLYSLLLYILNDLAYNSG